MYWQISTNDFDSNVSAFKRYLCLKFVWAITILSLPANKVRHCLIHPTASHANAVIHANRHLQTLKKCWRKDNATFQRDKNSELFGRKWAIAVHISVHINRFFQHCLVYLTGSDVAILTAKIFWPFSAFASPSDTSHSYGSRVWPCRCRWETWESILDRIY